MDWLYGEKRAYCATCKEAAQQFEKIRNCETCSYQMPEIIPENEAIWLCFTLCDRQFRSGPNGVFGLDWAVFIEAADRLGIATNLEFFELLRIFENHILTNVEKCRPK